jgi:hypothetical protein
MGNVVRPTTPEDATTAAAEARMMRLDMKMECNIFSG